MKFAAGTMAGAVWRLAARGRKPPGAGPRAAVAAVARIVTTLMIVAIVAPLTFASLAAAQSLYKYQDENGDWIFSDRPPDDGKVAEVRNLNSGSTKGAVTLAVEEDNRSLRFVAGNRFHAPVELRLRFSRLQGLANPRRGEPLAWVLPPRSETELLALDKTGNGITPNVKYEYEYIAGDPAATHRASMPYRVPVAIASHFPVTQAYPDAVTHTTPDAAHAIDIAMPIGTDIFAAREGVVFDVSSTNFKGGADRLRDGPLANIVQIMHDDGTYAIYAHLNWNSIRVVPGQRVQRGQYIADSGNTGFSSGPHLHFAVLRNAGMQAVSVPISFEGAKSAAVVPASGNVLTAY